MRHGRGRGPREGEGIKRMRRQGNLKQGKGGIREGGHGERKEEYQEEEWMRKGIRER